MADEQHAPGARRYPGARIDDGTDWIKLDYILGEWFRCLELVCRAGRLLQGSLPGVRGTADSSEVGYRAERVGELLRDASATWDEVIAPYFKRYEPEPADADHPFYGAPLKR